MKNDKTLEEENGPEIQITTVSPAPGCWLPRTCGITHNQSKFGENIYAAKRRASGHEILAKTDHTPGPGHWADQQPISGEGFGGYYGGGGNRGHTEFVQKTQAICISVSGSENMTTYQTK